MTSPLRWLEIDTAAIQANVAALKALTKAPTKFAAVVKANAYGHGLTEAADAAVAGGADWLGVVSPEEAHLLRDAGIGDDHPILVLGHSPAESWFSLARRHIQVTITNDEQLTELEQYRGPTLRVHLKVETGLARLGFSPDVIPSLVTKLMLPHVKVEGFSSHFASVEEQDLPHARQQLAEFQRAWEGQSGCRHIAATAAVLQLLESHLDMVRCGIGIYGLWPSAEVERVTRQLHPEFALVPALSYRTRLVAVKQVAVGTSVGYGRTYTVHEPTMVGVIPIGYAEGYDRHLSNRGQVLVGGQRVPVVGRIAMNMTMIDLTHVNGVKPGDVVTLIGQDGTETITADELATHADTINYEIVTRIPQEIPRIYSGNDEIRMANNEPMSNDQ